MKTHKILTRWAVRSYDVWGNKRDGYEVNQAFDRGVADLEITLTPYSQGTDREFWGVWPTDRQIRNTIGFTGKFEDNVCSDKTIYPEAPDGHPLGEMERIYPPDCNYRAMDIICGKKWVGSGSLRSLVFTCLDGSETGAVTLVKAYGMWVYKISAESRYDDLAQAKIDALDEAVLMLVSTGYVFTTAFDLDLDAVIEAEAATHVIQR